MPSSAPARTGRRRPKPWWRACSPPSAPPRSSPPTTATPGGACAPRAPPPPPPRRARRLRRLRARRPARGDGRAVRAGRPGPPWLGAGLRAPGGRRRAAAADRDPDRTRAPRKRRGPAGRGGAVVKPFPLPPNVLHRFYLGGERIARLRGITVADDHMPEEWIGAVNTSFGEPVEGLSRLEDGRFLRDVLAADPQAFLGPEHVQRFGDDAALLVKLLDVGERLPVHFHPGRAFAREHLGSVH